MFEQVRSQQTCLFVGLISNLSLLVNNDQSTATQLLKLQDDMIHRSPPFTLALSPSLSA